MQSSPDIGLIGPQMVERDARVHRSTMRFPTVWNFFCNAAALDVLFPKSRLFSGYLMRDFEFNKTAEVDVLNGWFWMTRRNALREVGGLDERFFMYGEDIDWCRRFRNAKWKNVYLAEASSVHYGGGSSSNSPVRFYIEKHRANFQYFKKHHNPFAQIGFWVDVFLFHVVRIVGHGFRYLLPGCDRNERSYKIKRSMACLGWLLGLRPDAIGEAQ
jgi:GT2 family glycosyltransferase